MPANEDFSFEVLVGGEPVREYVHEGVTYIECALDTPVSFTQTTSETVDGEHETQVLLDR